MEGGREVERKDRERERERETKPTIALSIVRVGDKHLSRLARVAADE